MVKKIVAVASALTLVAIFTAVPSNAESHSWRANHHASESSEFSRSFGVGLPIGAAIAKGPDTCC